MEHKFSILLRGSDELLSVSEFKNRSELSIENVTGIVLQTPQVGMVIALEDWRNVEWGSKNLENEGLGEAKALLVTSGLELTKNIVEHQKARGESNTAAIKCWELGVDNRQWYLPCLHELWLMAAFREEFNEIIDQLGFDERCKLDEEYRWSSSESNQNIAWYINFSNGYFSNGSFYFKCSSYVVRAVCAFSPLGNLSLPSNSQGANTMSDEELVIELRKRNFSGRVVKSIEYTV